MLPQRKRFISWTPKAYIGGASLIFFLQSVGHMVVYLPRIHAQFRIYTYVAYANTKKELYLSDS